ncbi:MULTISPECIES: DUF349 domain-containing protein [unclassified Arthrobacter]|uniref:DUF349 domain-containing protein n=1 Tax=unclassified Arthrobacter TaxID=235627 RepID=UPI0024DF5522|nr:MULTISPECIES: DUF349 domain-containing protein [unclassified Arthrobacter]MCC9145555.1 DUF349 domain-containing protein [Arthrobacter sp. zg-Y919]MDK1276784.1 DUF349 domain-containing protein [Arthrobacter sp. zg.Y919]MDM7989423.1 DUF349 domain-containing protein [Arthrobacter sp. zg-Y877]WIB04275.1 DUF349 domain-containing protein [Arthrobacter sp. zg-Y919]
MTDSQKSDETADQASTETSSPATPSPAALAARRPSPAAVGAAAKPVVAVPAAHSTPLEEAARFARVEEDGHVFLIVEGEETAVGQLPDASKEEALAYFVRKYDDVASQLLLLEQRMQLKAPAADIHKTLKHLAEQVADRKMVGDIKALDARIASLEASLKEAEAAERAETEAAKARELAAREAIVSEAEEIAAKDPATIQWKTSSNRMNELFDAWKTAQKNGPRLGRGTEDSLWKRFRSARTVFDRHRRAYFSQLDNENTSAKAAKEALIARAEELATSTDWGNTAAEYRQLMDEWKASKRASRKDDDALWARFRAAQDKFFAARQAANEVIDEEFAANLVVKEELLREAQALLPVTDLAAARKALQSIRERWEDAGKVPRADMGRMEAGIRKVEEAVKAAEDEHWQRSNPETKARTNSALSQLEATIASLEQDLADAEKAGNAKKIADARDALEARQQWLAMLQKSAQDFA